MYPIAYRTLLTLHEDDVAAVTSLYPAANVGVDVRSTDGHVHDRRRHADSRREHLGQGNARPARSIA